MSEKTIRIGKTVIETLTQGMYEDARFIYREYIQNSADQIDKAVSLSMLKNRKEGKINIIIDNIKNEIIFEDNATGIKRDNIYEVLGNIALSEKDRTKDKGFRGIGRLGGLGYCSELKFETSFADEPIKSIMTWDAKSLQEKLYDKKIKHDASAIVESVISLEHEDEESDSHYFKVILTGVNNELLLDEKNIREYLSMVAPVPYPTQFIFKSKIYSKSSEVNSEIDEYFIYLNTEQIFKPYTTNVYEMDNKNKRCIDEIFDINFFDIYCHNDNLIAWGWYGITRFEKQIPSIPNYYRGIRLRKGNIQVGNEQTLVNKKLHREDRGNQYFFGEVFCVHHDLIPNSRRDYFNENDILKQFEDKLRDLFHGILYYLYHRANDIKNAYKKINKLDEFKKELAEKKQKGFLAGEKEEIDQKIEVAKKDAESANKTIQKIKSDIETDPGIKNKSLKIILKKVEEKQNILSDSGESFITDSNNDIDQENEKIKFRTDNLSTLSKQERKFLSKIFSIIKKTLIPEQAEELIQKIEEELQ